MADETPVTDDATATVAQLHQRAADDYHRQQARHQSEDHRTTWRAA